MRVAIPIWRNRISPVFDTAQRLAVYETVDSSAGAMEEVTLFPMPRMRVNQLAQAGVETLICGAISRPLATMLSAAGIRVIPFVTGEADEILKAFAEGRLADSEFLMPGCRPGCRRGFGRRRAGRGQGWKGD